MYNVRERDRHTSKGEKILLLIQGRNKIEGAFFSIKLIMMMINFITSFVTTTAIEAVKKFLNFNWNSLFPSAIRTHCFYVYL